MTSTTGRVSNTTAGARPRFASPAEYRARGKEGFTLLELLLVMVILAIVAGIAAPSLSTFGKGRRVGDCAAQLVSLAHWARTQSITRGVTYRLNLDPNSRTYWLTMVRDDGTVDGPGEEFGRIFTAPDGITLTWDAPTQQDGQYIQFLPTGRTDPATIRVADTSGKIVEVSCFSPTEMFHVVTDAERQQG